MNASSEPPVALETLVTELSLAVGLLLRRLRAEASADGLTLSQTAALARLERDGPATTADLARGEAVKPQSMGATLAELERDGLVHRTPHPTDGRQILYALTERGIEARRKRSAVKQDWLLTATAGLNAAERETLLAAAVLIRRLSETD